MKFQITVSSRTVLIKWNWRSHIVRRQKSHFSSRCHKVPQRYARITWKQAHKFVTAVYTNLKWHIPHRASTCVPFGEWVGVLRSAEELGFKFACWQYKTENLRDFLHCLHLTDCGSSFRCVTVPRVLIPTFQTEKRNTVRLLPSSEP